ncbi:MAG: hypothetical protein ACMUJM_11990 [bacterium]
MNSNLFNININKPKLKKELVSPSQPHYVAYVIIAIIVLCATIIALRYGVYIPQKQRIKEKSEQRLFFKNQLEEIKTISHELEEKKSCYIQLKDEAIAWYDKLLEISQTISKKTWLSVISFDNNVKKTENTKEITIKGYIYSTVKKEYYAEIGELVMALNNSASMEKDFNPLRILYLKKSQKGPQKDIEFEIIGEIKKFK